MAIDEHTEELLALHEKEITRLKEERRIKAPILAAVKKYYEICEEETELAVCAYSSFSWFYTDEFLEGCRFRPITFAGTRSARSRPSFERGEDAQTCYEGEA